MKLLQARLARFGRLTAGLGLLFLYGPIHAQGSCPPARDAGGSAQGPLPLEASLEGFVYEPSGAPGEGTVVVSSAGGSASADARGHYRLDISFSPEADSVEICAVRGAGTNLQTSTLLVAVGASPILHAPPLWLHQSTGCSPSWLPTFGQLHGTDSTIEALAVYDDGSGPALFAAGIFSSAGGQTSNSIAKWDGSVWMTVGGGVNGTVNAMMVYDAGHGPALYVGGDFLVAGSTAASRIARWDGTNWTALGLGIDNGGRLGEVLAMSVFDDGRGPALYVGGTFRTAGGEFVRNIARWNGAVWSSVGVGVFAHLQALATYDDGAGPALYAGGYSGSGDGIWKWDGSTWTMPGGGLSGSVEALVVHDDGNGPALFAGGGFSAPGVTGVHRILKWDGTLWAPLGNGTSGLTPLNVTALTVYDDGSGPALIAGGMFSLAGGPAAYHVSRWDGTAWTALGAGMNKDVYALASFDGGSGLSLFVAGRFKTVGTQEVNHIAQWDGQSWTPLGQVGQGLSDATRALTVFDDGGGPALFAGGLFQEAGGKSVGRIAKWDGRTWIPLGTGMNDSVFALTVYDDGTGPALIAAGAFRTAGGVAADRIAKWDGTRWAALAGGANAAIHVLAVWDDGGGPKLYAGGNFTLAGGTPADYIASWDGTSWAPLGAGVNSRTRALAVFDDGTGPALFVGGSFTTAGGRPADRIAKWDGSGWTPLGSGVTGGGLNASDVTALRVYDDGTGPALYAGGLFSMAGGQSANGIASWNGFAWAPLGSGMGDRVRALVVNDDGTGPVLVAGGDFTVAGGIAAGRIAAWDGTAWMPLGSGMNGSVRTLASFSGARGPSLFAGGTFGSTLDSGDSYLARWGCLDSTPPTLTCPASVSVVDALPNGPGERVTFTVTADDDVDPAPFVVCSPPAGGLFPPGTTQVFCTATDASGNQTSCQFSVTVQSKAGRP